MYNSQLVSVRLLTLVEFQLGYVWYWSVQESCANLILVRSAPLYAFYSETERRGPGLRNPASCSGNPRLQSRVGDRII